MTESVDDHLQAIAKRLSDGETITATPRELIRWFGYFRRGRGAVERIRRWLAEHGLTTEPDFDAAWIDGSISVVLIAMEEPEAKAATSEEEPAPQPSAATVGGEHVVAPAIDPRYRISRLKSANTRPVSVAPDASVGEAVTKMLANDFSQLPVMNGESLKGMVSWRSIGRRLALGQLCETAHACMVPAHYVSEDTSLFDAISQVDRHDAVLVRDSANRIRGIVTANDFSDQFRQLAEPFVLLGEIENQIRAWIEPIFSKDDLRAAKNPNDEEREIEQVSDLTLGELLRLLQNPDSWSKLGTKLDRRVFVRYLEDIRRIRNDVMHFDPDGVIDQDLDRLRSFARFLEEVRGTHEG